MMSLRLRIGVLLIGLALTGCVSGRPHSSPDGYTPVGTPSNAIKSDYESCVKSCNDSFTRCGDIDVTRRSTGIVDAPADLFGANASCKAALAKCLPTCKGR